MLRVCLRTSLIRHSRLFNVWFPNRSLTSFYKDLSLRDDYCARMRTVFKPSEKRKLRVEPDLATIAHSVRRDLPHASTSHHIPGARPRNTAERHTILQHSVQCYITLTVADSHVVALRSDTRVRLLFEYTLCRCCETATKVVRRYPGNLSGN